MPIFSLTFGAFGDIVTATQLALQLVRTLSESSGASYEYQELVLELRSLTTALYSVEQTLSSTPLDVSTQHAIYAIHSEVTKCRSIMYNLQKQIEGYRRSLGEGNSKSTWQNSWRKIGWGLFKKEDLVNARTKLALSKNTIVLSLSSIASSTAVRLEDSMQKNNTVIQVSLEQIKTLIEEIPRTVGYTSSNALRFEDVLGRFMVLPLELCTKFESFNNIIQMRFADSVGRRLIERGQYDLTANGTGYIVDPAKWSTFIRPGITIEMSVVITPGKSEERLQCPRCRIKNVNSSINNNDWMECRRCGARYQVLAEDTTHIDTKSLHTKLHGHLMHFSDPDNMEQLVTLAHDSLTSMTPWNTFSETTDREIGLGSNSYESLMPHDLSRLSAFAQGKSNLGRVFSKPDTKNADEFDYISEDEDLFEQIPKIENELPFFRRIHVRTLKDKTSKDIGSIYVHPLMAPPGNFRWFSPCIYDCSKPLAHVSTLIKYLKAPMGNPSVMKMTVFIEESASDEDDVLLLKPLKIIASDTRTGVTVGELLDKLYRHLIGNITVQEWKGTSMQRRLALADDYAQGFSRNAFDERSEHRPPKGLKRIDCLQGKTFIERILREEKRSTIWHFYLVYGSSIEDNL